MRPDNLSTLKDDMIAFIEGHGMRRFCGFINTEEVPCVPWDSRDNPDGWKDFVELAKGAGSSFLTMNSFVLDREDVDYLVEQLKTANYPDDEDIDEARWLQAFVGKTGFVQLGWPYQGVVMLFEISTEWYERYQRLTDLAEEFGGMTFDENDLNDEH
jgi:hypothetical protein